MKLLLEFIYHIINYFISLVTSLPSHKKSTKVLSVYSMYNLS